MKKRKILSLIVTLAILAGMFTMPTFTASADTPSCPVHDPVWELDFSKLTATNLTAQGGGFRALGNADYVPGMRLNSSNENEFLNVNVADSSVLWSNTGRWTRIFVHTGTAAGGTADSWDAAKGSFNPTPGKQYRIDFDAEIISGSAAAHRIEINANRWGADNVWTDGTQEQFNFLALGVSQKISHTWTQGGPEATSPGGRGGDLSIMLRNDPAHVASITNLKIYELGGTCNCPPTGCGNCYDLDCEECFPPIECGRNELVFGWGPALEFGTDAQDPLPRNVDSGNLAVPNPPLGGLWRESAEGRRADDVYHSDIDNETRGNPENHTAILKFDNIGLEEIGLEPDGNGVFTFTITQQRSTNRRLNIWTDLSPNVLPSSVTGDERNPEKIAFATTANVTAGAIVHTPTFTSATTAEGAVTTHNVTIPKDLLYSYCEETETETFATAVYVMGSLGSRIHGVEGGDDAPRSDVTYNLISAALTISHDAGCIIGDDCVVCCKGCSACDGSAEGFVTVLGNETNKGGVHRIPGATPADNPTIDVALSGFTVQGPGSGGWITHEHGFNSEIPSRRNQWGWHSTDFEGATVIDGKEPVMDWEEMRTARYLVLEFWATNHANGFPNNSTVWGMGGMNIALLGTASGDWFPVLANWNDMGSVTHQSNGFIVIDLFRHPDYAEWQEQDGGQIMVRFDGNHYNKFENLAGARLTNQVPVLPGTVWSPGLSEEGIQPIGRITQTAPTFAAPSCEILVRAEENTINP
ncbi:MAG: hypothetical protein LBC86_00280, partial [Oscillospiraceae bacterium]|nr:hypothetical protein [Oscillospiraceae bacterium]